MPTPGCSPSLGRACAVSASPTSLSLQSLALHLSGSTRRVQPTVVAASVGVAAMLVGFAVYPASMPSWWNAALGLACGWLVLRWLDSRNPWVLGAAGVLTGVSFLVKSTGAFVAAAVALYLIMLISPDSPRRRLLVALGALIVLFFGVLLAGAPSIHAIALLFVPLALAAFIGFRKESVPRMPGGQVVPLSAVAIFSLAVVVPVGIFAIPYILSGNGDALISGWFRLPQLRFDSAAWSTSIPLLLLLLLGAVALLTYWVYRRINPKLVFGTWVVLTICRRFRWLAMVVDSGSRTHHAGPFGRFGRDCWERMAQPADHRTSAVCLDVGSVRIHSVPREQCDLRAVPRSMDRHRPRSLDRWSECLKGARRNSLVDRLDCCDPTRAGVPLRVDTACRTGRTGRT